MFAAASPSSSSDRSHEKQPRKGHENGLDVVVSPCRRRHSGGYFGEPKPPPASASPSLPLPRSGFDPRQPRTAQKLSLWPSNFSAPIWRRPPSDGAGSEICQSPLLEQAFDRWDSPENAPIAGDQVTDGIAAVGRGQAGRVQARVGITGAVGVRGGCHGERDNSWDHGAAVGFRNSLGF